MKPNNKQAGGAFLVVLVIASLALILTYSMRSNVNTTLGLAKKSLADSDLQAIRKTISEQLDCRQTLGVTSATALPVSCGSFSTVAVLRRADGSAINGANSMMGRWKVTGSCNNNNLEINVSRDEINPLTRLSWNASPQLKNIFKGQEKLCGFYFETAAPTTNPDLDCFVTEVKPSGRLTVKAYSGDPDIYKPYTSSYQGTYEGRPVFGARCTAPYTITHCRTMSNANSSTFFDIDNYTRDDTCFTDANEEGTEGGMICAVCCRLKR